MPGLLTQIEQAVGGLDIAALAGGVGGQYQQLGSSISGWNQGPPVAFSAAFSQLGGLQMPQLSPAGGLGGSLTGLLPSLQGDVGGLVTGLGADVEALPQRLRSGLLDAVGPLLQRIEALRVLLASDWSCGLVPGFAPVVAPAPGPVPAPSPSPPPSPAPAPGPAAAAPAASSTISPQKVADARTLIDTLPADMSAASLLRWLHARVGTTRPGYFTVRSLPLLDDVRDPLDTLVRWDAANAAAVQAELVATLQSLRGLVQQHTGGVFTAAAPAAELAALPLAALGTAAEDYCDALEALAAAVQTNNVAALPAALAAAQAALPALSTQNSAIAAAAPLLAALQSRLQALPGTLDAGICRLLVLLQPRATLADLTAEIGLLEPPVLPASAFDPAREVLASTTQQLEQLLSAIDISAVATPLTDALQSAGAAVQAIEEGLAGLAAQVSAALADAQTALQGLSLANLRDQAIAGLRAAVTQLQQLVSQALAPAAQALADAMTAVFDAMDDIDPEALAAPVREAVQALGDVVQQQGVQRLVELAGEIEAVAEQVSTLSLAPVADEVIKLIRELKTLIEGIDIASLPEPGPGLLSAAMGILPQSLVPLTDPLVADLDLQIAGAPTALLEQIKTLPDQARERLLAFSPRQALQPVLAEPFRAAVAELERFSPESWLASGDAALANLRRQLAMQIDIARLLAEPARAFASVTAELERLRPSALLSPLEHAIEGALQSLAQALPLANLEAGLEGAIHRLTSFTATVQSAIELARHLSGKLATLGDARSEFEAWVDSIVSKVPRSASGTLAAALADLRSAAVAAAPAALAPAWAAARAPLAAALNAALLSTPAGATATRQTRLAQARSQISAGMSRPAVSAAVPGLVAWINAANTRAAAEGLASVAALQRALAAADAALTQQFAELVLRYPGADGPLGALVPADANALRDEVRLAFLRQLGTPMLGLLASLKPLASLLDAGADALETLVDALDNKLGELLAAPQALADLLGDVAAVQQRLASLDLGVYTGQIDAVYSAFVDQVRALDPRGLQQPLEQARDQLLARLTLAELLPPPLRAQLTEAQRQLLAKIRTLDPDKLLLEPLDAEYRETVEPLVEAMDISATVQLIIDWLNGLPEDLRTQIARIDPPYAELLRLSPGGGGAGSGAGVSL